MHIDPQTWVSAVEHWEHETWTGLKALLHVGGSVAVISGIVYAAEDFMHYKTGVDPRGMRSQREEQI
eukprot:g2287.t1